jgi:two-component system response regulator AlgR
MRVLIADDEPLARARLKTLLATRSDVDVIGEAADGEAVIDACNHLRPDVVLLDVEMPGLPGTAVARHLASLTPRPQVIFCTAYEQHALSAFDLGATDYVLKPVRAERLGEALDRARARQSAPVRPAAGAWLRARSGADEIRVALDDVLYLLADEKYVAVHHVGGMRLVDESLRQLEALHGERLVRLHRNCLVPRTRLVGLKTLADGRVLARLGGTEVTPEVSRRNLPTVRQLLRAGAG